MQNITPSTEHPSWQALLRDCLRDHPTQEEFLYRIFHHVVRQWGGGRYGVILFIYRIFQMDIERLFSTQGYLHCTQFNFIIAFLCKESGLFGQEDIQTRWTHTWYVGPHQYLEIQLKTGVKIFLDPWNYQYGIEYGKYGRGFDSLHIFPIR